MTKKSRIILIVIISSAVTGITFTFPPLAQDPAYHNFADKRAFLGIPNFADSTGSLLFLIFSFMGISAVFKNRNDVNVFTMQRECILWGVFFVSTFLVGFGSGYYHLQPNNQTLVWDRLPMAIAFMSFFSLVIMERISEKSGLFLSPLFLVLGAGSVFYWDYTESLGNGDLRPYVLVQFLPMLLLPLLFWLFPARYSGLKYLGYVLFWYGLAKVLENFDSGIFNMTGGTLSGHSLKHLAAAISVYMMVVYVKEKRRIM